METFASFFEKQKLLLEMPQHYKGTITYQKDTKFLPISKNNLASYKILGEDSSFVYLVHPELSAGFVFDKNDLNDENSHDVLPVLRVSLREFPYKGFKQAHALRIRSAYSRQNIATSWYMLYVAAYDGIVSDYEHLEGGKTLWRSLIDHAHDRGFCVRLINLEENKKIPIGKRTPDDKIWSADTSKKKDVIVLEIP